jgi:hypothetical protein
MLLANLWDPCNSFLLTKTLMNLQPYLLGPITVSQIFSILHNRSQRHQEASAFTQKVEPGVFFSNRDVPVGKRHGLQKIAVETLGISLDVFDCYAI